MLNLSTVSGSSFVRRIIISGVCAISIILPLTAHEADDKFWTNFNNLISEENYNAAWKLIVSVDEADVDGNVDISRGIMLLSGLGVNQNTCDAVYQFEQARMKKSILASGYLELVYGGAYQQISAEEGERESLYRMGEKYLENYRSGMLNFPGSYKFNLGRAYDYFRRAEHQKYLPAKLRISEVVAEMRINEIEVPSTPVEEFSEIICPVRRY